MLSVNTDDVSAFVAFFRWHGFDQTDAPENSMYNIGKRIRLSMLTQLQRQEPELLRNPDAFPSFAIGVSYFAHPNSPDRFIGVIQLGEDLRMRFVFSENLENPQPLIFSPLREFMRAAPQNKSAPSDALFATLDRCPRKTVAELVAGVTQSIDPSLGIN